MKRTMIVTAFLAMGILMANSFAAAQDAPATTSGGKVTLGVLGATDVSSSKFEEYRVIPRGVSIPFVNLFSKSSMLDVNLLGYNIRQGDQRYMGWANFSWMNVGFDYNQIPHNMGNDAHLIWAETAPGVWSMSSTLRNALGNTADAAFPTSLRTYDFYNALLTPTFNAANLVDLSSMRQRGTTDFDLSKNLPFDLKFTYMREVKSGTRGQGGGDILGAVSPVVDVPEPLNDLTQDFGVRGAYTLKAGDLIKGGNVHAAFNRNVYNNRAETLRIDNPFEPFDALYTAAVSTPAPGFPAYGGPGTVQITNAPDNQANTYTAGVLLKFAYMTRVTGDISRAMWTQNAQFYPYTINSTVLTGTGAAASATTSLQAQSFAGKINTTTWNFGFSSRPIEGLALRARYRSYDLTNKTVRFVITGDTSGAPDRSWGAADAPTPAEPYGHATAQNYDSKSERFDAQASYDIQAFTLEGTYRRVNMTRTYREVSSNKDNGYSFSALYHAKDWLGFRGTYDRLSRTVSEGETTYYGYMADEAERTTTRTGFQVELTPMPTVGVNISYFRRNDDYPNRPDRIASASGVPIPGATPLPNTPSGLLFAKYDTFTGEFDYTPNEKIELSAYYTYEKNLQTNQWTTTNSATATPPLVPLGINNQVRYDGSDKTNTFGANGVFHFVPEKWTFTFMARSQKVDGLMDVSAPNTAGSFNTGRATLNPPGPQDINDWDDTTLTTIGAQLDYSVGKAWTLGAGYMYENYDYADAYTSGTTMIPFSVSVFMKADSGSYTANVLYTKLTYRF
jgi:hypothetical protein